ncbi:MAG: DUF835 domain-containing protein [Methanomassiliicoccales archaeon]
MRIEEGKLYLFKERVPLRTHQIMRKELYKGRETLYISKNSPSQVGMQFDFDSCKLMTLWLSPRPERNCVPPMNIKILEKKVFEFIDSSPKGIVALNGVEILEMWNGFRAVLDFLKKSKGHIVCNDNNIFISLDPKNISQRNLVEVEKLSDIVIGSNNEEASISF